MKRRAECPILSDRGMSGPWRKRSLARSVRRKFGAGGQETSFSASHEDGF